MHLSGNSSAGSYRDPSSVGTHSAARRSYYKTIGSPHFDATPEPSTSLKEFCAAPLTFIASGELHVLSSQEDDNELRYEVVRSSKREISPDVVVTGVSFGKPPNTDDCIKSNYERCSKINFEFESTSWGKMPISRARRIKRPNSYYRDFKLVESNGALPVI